MTISTLSRLFDEPIEAETIERYRHVIASMGFGVCRTPEINLRLPAYLIPIIHLAREVRFDDLEIYFVPHYQARIDRVSAETLIHRMNTMVEVLGRYIEHVHPGIAPKPRFLTDRPILPGGPLESLIVKLGEILAVANDPAVAAFAEKRGGREALEYMAAHAIYMRDPLDIDDLPEILEGATNPSGLMMMVGGPAEKIMWRARKLILDVVGRHRRWESRQLFTPVGRRPVYYRLNSEPTISDVEASSADVKRLLQDTSDPDIRRDLVYLFIDCTPMRDFSLLSRWKRFLADDVSELQRGYDRLRELYMSPDCRSGWHIQKEGSEIV